MYPLTVRTGNNALGAKNDAVLNCILKLIQTIGDLILGEFFGCLASEALKYLVSVMVVMVAVFVIVVMVMATAAAGFTMLVMVMMMVVIMIAIALIVVMVMMLVLMMMFATAIALIVMMVMILVLMMMFAAAIALIVMMVVMLVIVVMPASAIAFIIIVMMVVMLMLQTLQLSLDRIFALHRLKQLLTGQFSPRSDHDGSSFIMFADQSNALFDLLIGHTVGMTQNDASCIFNLIIEEFSEILHIHFAFIGIHNSSKTVQLCITAIILDPLNGTDDIAQLANAGGFDQNTVGMILIQRFF